VKVHELYLPVFLFSIRLLYFSSFARNALELVPKAFSLNKFDSIIV
jgi:hypothetical protein